MAEAAAVTIQPHSDPGLADAWERGAGWLRGEGEVARRMRVCPGGFFQAITGGKTVGTFAAIVHRGDPAIAWLGGMVVEPSHRRRGIARRLLQAAVDFSRTEGAGRIGLDATEMGRPLYESEGFVAVCASERWRRLAPIAAPVKGSWSLVPISSAEFNDVDRFDRERFGARRLPWVAEVVANRPGRSFIAYDRRSGAVAGFALGQEAFIGPVVADDPEVAVALTRACEGAGVPPRLHLLEANAEALHAFAAAGYEREGARVLRMMKGGPLPGRLKSQFAVAAWAVG